MNHLLTVLLFPYFAPLVAISVIASLWMAGTPSHPSDGTGPSGSDALGVYFIVTSVVAGGIIQGIAGIPLCAGFKGIRSRAARATYAAVIATVPIAITLLLLLSSPPPLSQLIPAILLVTAAFGFGSWIPYRHIVPPPVQAGSGHTGSNTR
ncbi:MAG: hypothetical protein EOP85_05160 [Verrucomicrobiaceae bacterium]|nr:MAG: hypothetical protein EOP85_05160 [Verrucomicrobiaceae bacterium]